MQHSSIITGVVATIAIGLFDLGGRDSWPNGRPRAYNAIFFASIVGALSCGLASRSSQRLNS